MTHEDGDYFATPVVVVRRRIIYTSASPEAGSRSRMSMEATSAATASTKRIYQFIEEVSGASQRRCPRIPGSRLGFIGRVL